MRKKITNWIKKQRGSRVAVVLVVAMFLAFVLFSYFSQRQELSNLRKGNSKMEESFIDIKQDIYDLQNAYENIPSTSSASVVEKVVGPKGPQGETGPQGTKGSLPDGNWERYCLIEKEIFGYDVRGVLMRKNDGNCESGWKEIKLWEK